MMSVAIRAQEPEIEVRAYRRRFSTAYKLRILAEADACTEPGAVGALLRREGLYSSHLATWRAQRAAGARAALGQPRGRKPQPALVRENARLRQELARTQDELTQAREVIALQGKVSALLQALAGKSAPPPSTP
jgi:transposase-like protein